MNPVFLKNFFPKKILAGEHGKAAWFGVLMAVAESDADARNGISILQDRLQKLGWKDGINIRIDYRWGNGDPDRIQDLAKELVDLQPDVLVGHSTPSAKGHGFRGF